jgi:hypothetical protein
MLNKIFLFPAYSIHLKICCPATEALAGAAGSGYEVKKPVAGNVSSCLACRV